MKRILLAVAAVGLLVTLSPSALSAQGMSKNVLRWSIGGGILMPLGDYNKADKPGWVVGGGGTCWLHGGQLGIRADVSYSQTAHDPGPGNNKIVGGMASALYALQPASAPARFVLSGGVGVYNVKESVSDSSQTKIGFGVGAAVALKMGSGGTRLVIGTRFTSVATEGNSVTFLPITVSLAFGR